MAHIEDYAITAFDNAPAGHPLAWYVRLQIGVDVRFNPTEALFANLGFNEWSLLLNVSDEDTLIDDGVPGSFRKHVMQPGSVQELTGIEINLDFHKTELQKLEVNGEQNIELYANLALMKDGTAVHRRTTRRADACIYPTCFFGHPGQNWPV